ncbi:MAG TPA: FliH/SctL family protein [Novosphingobium sp.]
MSSLTALTGPAQEPGFRLDSRFALAEPQRPAAPPPVEVADPVALAWAEGYAKGVEDAEAHAALALAAEADARTALEFAFAKFDAEMAETLRQRLQDTVIALCEATLVPYALDVAALTERVQRAVAMLSRADDDRVIRLHPEDLPQVAKRLPKDWKITPDASLERGALRVETQNGGVEDGPAQWRRALAEAFHAC